MMGMMIDEFNVPVCDSFQAKILNDQLCYEIDLNKFKSNFSAQILKKGITFFVDNSEDKQYSWGSNTHKRNGEKGNIFRCQIHRS